ncbi:hypothetical protein FB451DRAFT_1188527 [Mycena latifolia]|nr:hypothetical protein FB451DRAFT_1188527 [Mycena latifolia]
MFWGESERSARCVRHPLPDDTRGASYQMDSGRPSGTARRERTGGHLHYSPEEQARRVEMEIPGQNDEKRLRASGGFLVGARSRYQCAARHMHRDVSYQESCRSPSAGNQVVQRSDGVQLSAFAELHERSSDWSGLAEFNTAVEFQRRGSTCAGREEIAFAVTEGEKMARQDVSASLLRSPQILAPASASLRLIQLMAVLNHQGASLLLRPENTLALHPISLLRAADDPANLLVRLGASHRSGKVLKLSHGKWLLLCPPSSAHHMLIAAGELEGKGVQS